MMGWSVPNILRTLGSKRLRWMFFIAVFPSLVTLPLFSFVSYQRECRHLEEETLQTSRALSQLIDLELLDTARHIQTFGNTSETLNQNEFPSFYKAATREFVKTGLTDGICLTDEHGQQILNTAVPYGTPLPVTNNIDRIRAVLDSDRARISNLITGTVLKRRIIAVDTPVTMENGKRYVLNAIYFPHRLNRFLQRQALPPGWIVSIFDRTGTITARSANAEQFVGEKVIAPILALLPKQAEGVLSTSTLEGIPSVIVFHQSKRTGLGVAIGVPNEMLFAELRRQYGLFAVAISLVILLSMYLALRFGGFLERQRQIQEELNNYRFRLERLVEEKTSSLRETVAQLEETQFAMNKAGIGILRIDPRTGHIHWMNEYTAERLGYTPAEFVDLKLTDIDPTLDSGRLHDLVANMRENGRTRFETTIRNSHDRTVPVEVICYLLQADNEHKSDVIAFVTDISERKLTESYLRSLNAEMERLNHLQVAKQTVAALAHELNQPLNAITSYSGAALRLLKSEAPSTAKVIQAVEGCSQQAQRAGNVVLELLSFLSHGKIDTEQLSLNNLVRTALDRAKTSCSIGFSADLHLEPELPPVKVNRLQIEKVLGNLIRNGVEAMHEHDRASRIRIEVRTSSEPGMAQVTLRDNGPGIDPAIVNKIFDPFFSTKAKGIGMGLAVSRAIIEAHGGQLWAESEPGSAAVFHFTLPFAPAKS